MLESSLKPVTRLCSLPIVHSAYSNKWCCAGHRFESAPLPFELRVLESSLKAVTRLCSSLAREIEADANPALEALTKQVQGLVVQIQ